MRMDPCHEPINAEDYVKTERDPQTPPDVASFHLLKRVIVIS
jgi:hypothetical protein